MGWPSERQWDALAQSPLGYNHFHVAKPKDIYVVPAGSWHTVVDHPRLPPVSVAFDDIWLGGGCAYLSSLIQKDVSLL